MPKIATSVFNVGEGDIQWSANKLVARAELLELSERSNHNVPTFNCTTDISYESAMNISD